MGLLAAGMEWGEFWDEGRGRHYYYHKETGIVQWAAPTEWHNAVLKQQLTSASEKGTTKRVDGSGELPSREPVGE